jgi:hypothetical protein
MPALNLPTNLALVEAWAGALYGSAVGQTTMAQVNSDIVTYGGLNNTLNAYYSAAFGSMSTTAIGTMVAANVGLTGTTATTAAQIITATLNATVPAARGAAISSMLNTFSGLTADTTWGAGAIAWNTTVNTEVTYNLSNATDNTLAVAATTVTSQTAAAAAAAATAAANAAAAAAAAAAAKLTLTTGVDTIVGTTGNDTFTATAATWNVGDTISGNGGADTLNATLNGAGPQQSASTLTGVQTINLTATPNPSSIDLTGVTGVTSINNANSSNGATLTVTGVGAVANTAITGGNSSTTVTYTTAAVAGTADAATLTLNGVNAGSSYVTSGVETLTVASNTAANTLTALTDTGITRLNITGSQALTVTGTVGGTTLTRVDASADTGALTLTLAGAGTAAAPTGVTFTGGSGATTLTTGGFNDTVTEGNGNNTVNTGAGNDTITTGTGTNTTTPGTGNDTITLNGTDTVRFAEAGPTNADVINGFSLTSNDVISLNLGAAQLAATTTTAAQAASAGTFGVLQTGALTPTLGNVNGLGTTSTISGQIINANATATTGTTVLGASNILFLNGTFTDGTAQGAINTMGTTATTGITTTANGKFILVTYSVGNVAQVWSYGGDSTANGDIDAAELSLVATLNGVSANSLTAAAFSTYLTTPTASTTVSNAGQVINLSGTLNTVNNITNAAGQFLTGGADTINVAVGALPTGAATSTMGLTVLDNNAGDSDTLNATVLNPAWDQGTTLANIENVNLTMTVADTTGWVMTTTMPGTTTLTVTGTQATGAQSGAAYATAGISGIVSGTAFGVGAGYSGNLIISNPALAALTLNLGGNSFTTAATSPTVTIVNSTTNSTVDVTALTVNATANGSYNADPQTAAGPTSTSVFNATTTTLTGSGNINLYGTAAQFNGSTIVGNGAAYTGALTLTPTTAADMDLGTIAASGAAGTITGVRTIDLTSVPTFNNTITLAAANNSTAYGTGPVTVNFAPTSSSALTGLTVNQLGSSQTNALTVALGANATNVTNGINVATGINTLTITDAAASTVTATIGGITMSTGAGTQAATVSGAGNFVLGTFQGDSLTTSGVTGTVSVTLVNGSQPVAFTGGNGNTVVIGGATTTSPDSITTGGGNDYIGLAAVANANLNGGLGNDTYAFTTSTGSSFVTDTGGTNTLLFTGNAGNTTGLNGGTATILSAGINQIAQPNNQVLTVAPGQFAGGAVALNTSTAGGAMSITLSAPGVLNLSGATGTATSWIGSAGTSVTGAAVTALTETGFTGANTISAPTTIATTVVPGGTGLKTINLGTHAAAIVDTVGPNAALATTNLSTVSGFNVATDIVRYSVGTIGTLETGANAGNGTAVANGATPLLLTYSGAAIANGAALAGVNVLNAVGMGAQSNAALLTALSTAGTAVTIGSAGNGGAGANFLVEWISSADNSLHISDLVLAATGATATTSATALTDVVILSGVTTVLAAANINFVT